MDSISDDNSRSGRKQALSNRISDHIADIECRKEKLDAEMIELEQKLAEAVNYVTGSRERRKARKIVLVSFAVGVSSLTCGINFKIFGFPRGILPFTTTLGFGSLVVSLYFLKRVWYPSKDSSEMSIKKSIRDATDDVATPSNISAKVEDVVVFGKEFIGDSDSTISV